jgi:hypothetical protein
MDSASNADSSSSSSNSGIPIRPRDEEGRHKIILDHLSLLIPAAGQTQRESQDQEVVNAPIFAVSDLGLTAKYQILEGRKSPFTQHGLLAGLSDVLDDE